MRSRKSVKRSFTLMGVKQSILVEKNGGPLACCIAGANVNDHLLLAQTLDAIVALTSTASPGLRDMGNDAEASVSPDGLTATLRHPQEPCIRAIDIGTVETFFNVNTFSTVAASRCCHWSAPVNPIHEELWS